jgi:hypothetical protein
VTLAAAGILAFIITDIAIGRALAIAVVCRWCARGF